MTFTVVWMPTAENDLALLWVTAGDRQAVTDAANRIDRELRVDGHMKGMDAFGDRYYVDPPLAVFYDVSVPDRLVRVGQIVYVGMEE